MKRSGTPHNPEKQRDLVHGLFRAWTECPYDGLRGEIPVWMPASDRGEFASIRCRLFLAITSSKVSLAEIRSRLDWRLGDDRRLAAEIGRGGDVTVDLSIPPQMVPYDDDISFLALLFETAELGQAEGLKRRIGETIAGDAASGRQRREINRKVAKHPRPNGQLLPIELLVPIVTQLRNDGTLDRRIVSKVHAALSQKRVDVSVPTVRTTLQRHGLIPSKKQHPSC